MDILKLINNIDEIAYLWKSINLKNIELHQTDYYCTKNRFLSGKLIYANRKQFKSSEQAFVSFYKKIVFDNEMWDDLNTQLTEEQWKDSLIKFIIPGYIHIKNHKRITSNEFWNRFRYNTSEFGKDSDYVEKFKSINTNLEVLVIYEYEPSITIYGVSNETCFLYDYYAGD